MIIVDPESHIPCEDRSVGEIWVKGGASDRFTRSLDMRSFAHKVSREDEPFVYWFAVLLYVAFIGVLLWAWLFD